MFNTPGWDRITSQFNSEYDVALEQIQNKWKTLKLQYSSFRQLLEKSGWGWDDEMKVPVPPYPEAWDEVSESGVDNVHVKQSYDVCYVINSVALSNCN
jgi:hypothetical protein